MTPTEIQHRLSYRPQRKHLTLCINSDAVGGAYKEADCFHLPDRTCPAGLTHPQACYCECASVDYVGMPTNNPNAPAKDEVAVVRVLACNFPFDRNGQELAATEVAAPARLHHQRKDPKPRRHVFGHRHAPAPPQSPRSLQPLIMRPRT